MSIVEQAGRAAIRAALRVPTPLLVAFAGGLVRRDGQILDPQLASALAAAQRLGLGGIERMTPADARVYAARHMGLFDTEPRPMETVLDTFAPGPDGPIAIRLYRPRRAGRGLIVYLHGGGGVIGSVDAADAVSRLIADETRCQVAVVEYRLAPEHRHPAAIEDAEAAWRYLVDNAASLGADPGRMVLLGDSMGAFLAAHVERRVRTGPRPALMVLLCPLVDLTFSSPSFGLFRDGFVLTGPLVHWFVDHYLPDPDQRRAASPLFFDDVAGAPPTLIVTAGFDPLRDDGQRYGERLREAGAAVTYRCHADMVHGYYSMTGAIASAATAMTRLAADIRGALDPDEVAP